MDPSRLIGGGPVDLPLSEIGAGPIGDPCAETERIDCVLVSRRAVLVAEKLGVKLPVDCIIDLGNPAIPEVLVDVPDPAEVGM
jgi:hypothetical protein